ncbi:proline and serine-rich protein 2 [Bufo gargarizans]|uniref:proline and serine-rich protein 2 n=1 Tax=Bufo gargarizans TaxID=30331 RepID=UPI001CF54833|nr:proline and serine-rich protein 2 [Bufo gargarizans]XP_044132683.1 proline and serine-rich protein 2 [Bufo gargarizans]
MPSNLLKLSSSIMESEFHNRSDFERSGSFDSQSSQCSRSRSSHFDDENLKYLTNEEKNALMFFEETLDAFEDDPEEPPLSANSSLGYYSPRSTEDSHSDTDDIIDLVETDHNHVEISPEDSGIGLGSTNWNLTQKDSWTSQSPTTVSSSVTIPLKETENLSPDLPSEQRKLHGAIPTPVIIAQKMLEKKRESGNMSPLSPKDGKSPELKKSVGTSPISEGHFIFPGSPNTKPSRFPNNIIIKQVGKQYNKTIAKAAVNVQERKAQVLANIHGPGWFADEIDATNRHEQVGRRTSFREVTSEQTRYEALIKLGLVKEIPVQADVGKSPVSNGEHSVKMMPPETSRRHSNENESISKILMNEPSAFVSLGKTVVIKGEPGTSIERNKRPSSIHIAQEKTQINTNQEIKRTYSMPRPTGFRSQGITVQFSGRDSSEESRKDALRRLGLMSGH